MSYSPDNPDNPENCLPTRSVATAAIVGLGTIGSAAATTIARDTRIGRLLLVDHDVVATSNLRSQNVVPADVDRPKADVVSNAARAIRPDLEVTAWADRVENVPRGMLRADILASCVDSRRARQSINEVAQFLRVPWVDAAVDAARTLMRVTVYLPGPAAPCLECAWSDQDYALVEQVHPCTGELQVPSTAAPAELGQLAGAYAVLEMKRLLAGDLSFAGRQLFVDGNAREMFVSRFDRNPNCRCDHGPFTIRPFAGPVESTSLHDLLGEDDGALAVPGHEFVKELACPRCAVSWTVIPVLQRELTRQPRCCQRCGEPGVAVGLSVTPELTRDPSAFDEPLVHHGLANGDIVRLRRALATGTETDEYIELGVAHE